MRVQLTLFLCSSQLLLVFPCGWVVESLWERSPKSIMRHTEIKRNIDVEQKIKFYLSVPIYDNRRYMIIIIGLVQLTRRL